MRIYRTTAGGKPILATDRAGALVALGELPDALRSAEAFVPFDRMAVRAGSELGPLGDARLLPPVRPGKIVAIGLNYQDHIDESGMDAPDRPLVFTKFTSSVIASGDPIVVDRTITQRVDWEVELAVVVGRRMRSVAAEHALDHVLGYTVANDVSARDVQFGDGQWVRGKSLDTFCPLGPCLVTPEEFGDPQSKRLWTLVNGEAVQQSDTSRMVFGVAELLAFCSASFTLEPGDVLLTGTPWGCGEFMTPQRSLQDGDVVETGVEGIGTLVNAVVEDRRSSRAGA